MKTDRRKEKELENEARGDKLPRIALSIYKEHLAVIEKIPTFDLPEEGRRKNRPPRNRRRYTPSPN